MNPGFTLIELAVVIAVVAIAVAVMLPRAFHLKRAARIGHLQAAHGAVQAAALLVHAAVLARNGRADTSTCSAGAAADNRTEGPGSVCTEAGLVRTQHGYPASVAPDDGAPPGIAGAAGIGPFGATRAQLRALGFEVVVAGGVTTVARADAREPARCRFTYTEPRAAGLAPAVSAAVLGGC